MSNKTLATEIVHDLVNEIRESRDSVQKAYEESSRVTERLHSEVENLDRFLLEISSEMTCKNVEDMVE